MAQAMTTAEVQEFLGLASPAAARVQLRRWDIKPIGRQLNGQKTWPAAEIRQAAATRPGRGHRSDLHREP